MGRAALLYSGGLDSYCAHVRLVAHGTAHDLISIDCGTETNKQEAIMIKEQMRNLNLSVRTLKGIDLSNIEEGNGFVPLRNLFFAALPVMHNYDVVYLAAVKGEGSLDKSLRFFKDTSDLFSYTLGRTIQIKSPVDIFTKKELVEVTVKLGYATPQQLMLTTSCYRPLTTMTGRCGTCNACIRRWVAMYLNDIREPYDVHPYIAAKDLYEKTKSRGVLKALVEQPLGRWPDLILTNKELIEALFKFEKLLAAGREKL